MRISRHFPIYQTAKQAKAAKAAASGGKQAAESEGLLTHAEVAKELERDASVKDLVDRAERYLEKSSIGDFQAWLKAHHPGVKIGSGAYYSRSSLSRIKGIIRQYMQETIAQAEGEKVKAEPSTPPPKVKRERARFTPNEREAVETEYQIAKVLKTPDRKELKQKLKSMQETEPVAEAATPPPPAASPGAVAADRLRLAFAGQTPPSLQLKLKEQ